MVVVVVVVVVLVGTESVWSAAHRRTGLVRPPHSASRVSGNSGDVSCILEPTQLLADLIYPFLLFRDTHAYPLGFLQKKRPSKIQRFDAGSTVFF